jgi:hypothetical protein
MTSKSITTSKRLSRQSPLKWSPLPYMRTGCKIPLRAWRSNFDAGPRFEENLHYTRSFQFLKEAGCGTQDARYRTIESVLSSVARRIAKWKDFNHLRIVVLHGPKKEQLLQQDADVYIINPEGLEWLVYGARNCSRHAFELVGGRLSPLTPSQLTSLLNSSTPEEFASKLSNLSLELLHDAGASQARPLPTVSLIFSVNAMS